MLKDFKEFIMKGNLIDLAVAFIIGAAFKTVITSFVKDVIMPPIGLALGDVNFSDLKYILKEATTSATGEAVAAVAINYGSFIQTIIDLIIIGFCVFLVIKAYINMQKKKEEAPAKPPVPSAEENLLTEIRDLLKK